MFNSKEYWEKRYQKDPNGSGDESYGNLALFKAKVINAFWEENQIQSIIDYGVGDGNQLKLLKTENRKYIGLDVSTTILQKCKTIFAGNSTMSFLVASEAPKLKAEFVMSCDVLYHLIEPTVFDEYMNNLFDMSQKFVVIYAPNMNFNECVHVKKREFVNYIFDKFPTFDLIERIKGPIGCPFYFFQKKDTFVNKIPQNILQVTKEKPVLEENVNKILSRFEQFSYNWFNDKSIIQYFEKHQLEDFPNIIQIFHSFTKGQHKADLFRYFWLYLNGGVFFDDDLIPENNICFDKHTFISVKSYHTNKNSLFNGFIACTKFNPIIYKALKHAYNAKNSDLVANYHLLCNEFYNIHETCKQNQKTYLLHEIKSDEFKEGVKIYDHTNKHVLTHWCYSKKICL